MRGDQALLLDDDTSSHLIPGLFRKEENWAMLGPETARFLICDTVFPLPLLLITLAVMPKVSHLGS